MKDTIGKISDIQRFCITDGPGIRTTVFFSGCNLHCVYCHNPEAMSEKPQLMFFASACIHCGTCEQICPNHASKRLDHTQTFDRSACVACGLCTNMCPVHARKMSVKTVHVCDVMEIVQQDRPFYEQSGGGVTICGGEPLLQPNFCAALAKACLEQSIHVLIDTALCVSTEALRKTAPFADAFYVDIKAADARHMRMATGADMDTVIANLRQLLFWKIAVTVRIPIIPLITDDSTKLDRLADRLARIGVKHVELLPFHRLGVSKYEALGLMYTYSNTRSMDRRHVLEYAEQIKDRFDSVHVP